MKIYHTISFALYKVGIQNAIQREGFCVSFQNIPVLQLGQGKPEFESQLYHLTGGSITSRSFLTF